jgi:hypothetical protein
MLIWQVSLYIFDQLNKNAQSQACDDYMEQQTQIMQK